MSLCLCYSQTNHPLSPITAHYRKLHLTTAQARINLKSIKTRARKHDTLETLSIFRPSVRFLLDTPQPS